MLDKINLSRPVDALRFCIYWLLATIAGVILGAYAYVAVSMVRIVPFMIAFSLVGLFIGFSQWLVFRQFILKSGWWIFATFLGWNLGFGITRISADLLHNVEITIVFDFIFLVVTGAIIGISQWLVIRQIFTKSGWWIFASAISFGFAGLVSGGTIYGFWDLLAIAVIRGSIMGFTLFLILYHSMAKGVIRENSV